MSHLAVPKLLEGISLMSSAAYPWLCHLCSCPQEVIEISKDKLPGYNAKIKSFYEEHIHTDEEIRYILAGTGGPQSQDTAAPRSRCLLLNQPCYILLSLVGSISSRGLVDARV